MPGFVLATPSLADLGDLNERAYGDAGTFGPIARSLHSDAMSLHGLRTCADPFTPDRPGPFVCVMLALRIGDDVGVHFLATEAEYRRKGLASHLLVAVLRGAAAAGATSASLQASEDGLTLYKRLGFRVVATLRGFVLPAAEGTPSE
jgi:ribosomal protein S18 acetylase RimI-like enzyme